MIRVNFDGVKYVASLSIDEKPRVQAAGFFWDENLKRYTSMSHVAAYRLLDFCDPQTRQYVLEALMLEPLAPDFSRIDWPVDKRPFVHQVDFVKWAMSRKASYIAGEPGTGKTPAAVMCMNAEPGPVIVICPAFLSLNWKDEIEAWTTWAKPPVIDIVTGQKHDFNASADVYILPWSLVHVDRVRQFFFQGRRFKWVFVDEAHYAKDATAKRTISLVGGRVPVGNRKKNWVGFHKITAHIVNMSGSPIPNGRPIELYPIVKAHSPQTFGYLNKHDFGVRYGGGHETEWGWRYDGASNLDEFREKLTQSFMITARLDDCVDLPPELPPKFIYLEDERIKKHRESEVKLLSRVRIDDIIAEEIRTNAEFAKRVEHASLRAEDENKVFVQGGFQFISELRKLNGLKKVPQAVSVIKQILDDLDELVVFAWHKSVINFLADELKKYEPFVITGGTSHKVRHESVKEFQASRTRNLVIANIEAAGVGLTLTKAAKVLFVEPSWVPGQNDQAVRRVRRITQTRATQAMFLVWKDSLDHRILNAHQTKQWNVNEAIFKPGE